MSLYDISDLVVRPLGGNRTEEDSQYVNSDGTYDVAIGGIPFLLANSEQYPYTRGLAQSRKEQLDTSPTPGEQSFSDWWIRSQPSFHGGAGVNYLEPSGDDPTPIRYKDSAGVDVWTQGEVTLLRDTDKVHDLTGGTTRLLSYSDGLDMILVTNATNAYRHDGTTASAATWGGSGTILSLCDDGTSAYIADSTGIYKMALTSGSGTLVWVTGSSSVKVAFVKQRLVAGIGAAVYELTGTGTALPTALYTHPDADWTWTAFAEGPGAIYAAGKSGIRSAIFKFTLDTDGAMPTMAAGVVAAELPHGEVVDGLFPYLGAYLAIGTSKGVRIGLMDPSGDLQYGPLTVETSTTVRGFAARDRFIYAGVDEFVDGYSGLVRIDLGQETEPGRFAYAADLASTSVAAVRSVAPFGESDRLVFAAGADVFLESETRLVSTGWIESGQIRFSTLEPKRFSTARLRGAHNEGTLVIQSVQRDGDVTSLASYGSGSDLDEEAAAYPVNPVESIGIKVTLTRAAADDTAGPTLYGFQVKAAPVVDPGEEIRLPLMMYDHETDTRNLKSGREGWGYERYQRLIDLVTNRGVMSFKDLRTDEVLQVKPVDLQLTQVSSRRGTSTGFGGICYLTVKTFS